MKASAGYHHGDLRAALVREARRTIEREGDAALSLRACARALEVDVAATYRHFKSKNDVLAAVAADGFIELAGAMEQAMHEAGARPQTSVEYFTACGVAYVRYGVEHPMLYRLMFGGRCSAEAIAAQSPPESARAGPDAYALLSAALDLLRESGRLDPARRPGAELTAWSLVHGLVSLANERRGGASPAAAIAVAKDQIAVLVRGLRP